MIILLKSNQIKCKPFATGLTIMIVAMGVCNIKIQLRKLLDDLGNEDSRRRR